MNQNIQKALRHLQNTNYAGYFEEMNQVVPKQEQNEFNNLQR